MVQFSMTGVMSGWLLELICFFIKPSRYVFSTSVIFGFSFAGRKLIPPNLFTILK